MHLPCPTTIVYLVFVKIVHHLQKLWQPIHGLKVNDGFLQLQKLNNGKTGINIFILNMLAIKINVKISQLPYYAKLPYTSTCHYVFSLHEIVEDVLYWIICILPSNPTIGLAQTNIVTHVSWKLWFNFHLAFHFFLT
jgi:hypothetical protein